MLEHCCIHTHFSVAGSAGSLPCVSTTSRENDRIMTFPQQRSHHEVRTRDLCSHQRRRRLKKNAGQKHSKFRDNQQI